MSPNDLIKRFPQAIIPSAAANVRKTIQYHIASPLYVVIADGQCEVHDGVTDRYDVGLTIKDEHLVAMMKGELSGMAAFVSGKLKVDGDRMFAQRIPSLFDSNVFLAQG